MPSSFSYDLLQACQQPGCPVCRLEQSTIERYISRLLYESVNDVQVREHLRASLGFCREHARLAVEKNLGNALGFAIIYQDLLNHTLKQWRNDSQPARTRRWPALLRQLPKQVRERLQRVIYALTPQEPCMVCQQRERTFQLILSSFMESLQKPTMRLALQTSDGLCIPHLKKAFETVTDAEMCDELISIHREKLESLHGQLVEFIRKNDYRFTSESMGPEGASWRRAISKVIGDIDQEET